MWLIEHLVPTRPPKKPKAGHTSPNHHRLPQVVLRGCFAAKNSGIGPIIWLVCAFSQSIL